MITEPFLIESSYSLRSQGYHVNVHHLLFVIIKLEQYVTLS